MTLYLVRHGRAARGLDDLDPGLDELGHAQARAAAEALRSTDARRLVVSPLRRTRETAAPIAAALGLSPMLEDRVAEVFDPSLPPPDRQSMIGPLLAGRWSEQREALQSFRRRVLDALESFASEPTVVVSHFIAISVAIGAALGDDRVAPVPVANASITRLLLENGHFRLEMAGDIAHLGSLEVTGGHTALAGKAPLSDA